MDPIETERLVLRPKTLGDAASLHRILADPRVAAWLGARSPDEWRARLERSIAHQRRHGFSMWAMVEKESRELVGHCGLQLVGHTGPEIEVGWAVDPERWGRGYATEAGRASLRHGFDVIGFDAIIAVMLPENTASRRVAEHLGMVEAGTGQYYGQLHVRYEARSLAQG